MTRFTTSISSLVLPVLGTGQSEDKIPPWVGYGSFIYFINVKIQRSFSFVPGSVSVSVSNPFRRTPPTVVSVLDLLVLLDQSIHTSHCRAVSSPGVHGSTPHRKPLHLHLVIPIVSLPQVSSGFPLQTFLRPYVWTSPCSVYLGTCLNTKGDYSTFRCLLEIHALLCHQPQNSS